MVTQTQMVLRLLLALLLGGMVGFEREAQAKAAGFRTHILVCMGACLIMLTSMHIFDIYKGVASVDPARIAAQVVSGIGFLGAGTIMRFKASVVGLTTAASLWAISGVGLAVGVGLYLVSIVTAVLMLISLVLLSKIENRLGYKDTK